MKVRNEREAEILRLHRVEGWPVGTIARELGVHASTVRRVLGQAGELVVARAQQPSIVDPYLPFIHETLEKYPKLAASRLHAMVRARGYPGGPSHFRDIIASIRPRPKAEAFLRIRTLPGEQGQVDWESFGKIRIGRTSASSSAAGCPASSPGTRGPSSASAACRGCCSTTTSRAR